MTLLWRSGRKPESMLKSFEITYYLSLQLF